MKLKLTAYLLKKKGFLNKVLKEEASPEHKKINLGGRNEVEANFYWESEEHPPQWVDLFSEIGEIDLSAKSIKALLVFNSLNRVICFAFGHGRHFINQHHIERNFGLAIALSLTDPELIKSLDKSNIDPNRLYTKNQANKNKSIIDFDFKFDCEILKSISGVIVNEKDEKELITGSDGITLSTEVSLSNFPQIAERLINAYVKSEYKKKYPWIDNIKSIRDKELIEKLDEAIIDKINQKDFTKVHLSPPKLIDYDDFSGFYYINKRGKHSPCCHSELTLEICLKEKKYSNNLDIDKAKKEKIFLNNEKRIDEKTKKNINSWHLYDCLNGEIDFEGRLYLLSEGAWYSLDKNFVNEIDKYFNNFSNSSLSFPGYEGKHEGEYLVSVAKKDKNLALLDRKLVNLSGSRSSIEFCDLLTREGDLIHVKKYSSSSTLSHLFSQAYVSAETLLHNSNEIVEKVNSKLKDCSDFRFTFNPNDQPRKNKIIFGIMQKKPGKIHFPFFSKVNFRQYSQRLKDMGFEVELLKINI